MRKTTESHQSMRNLAAFAGLSAVILFVAALLVFATLDAEFQVLDDYVSELGAKGKPFGLWFNLVGFLSVGLLLAVFGFAYGRILDDRVFGVLLVVFGLGFAMTAIPIEEHDGASGLSRAHILAITLGLAAWMFALARMAHITTVDAQVRRAANFAAGLFLLPMAGQLLQAWQMPLTHRLVFTVVFGWFLWTSVQLLSQRELTTESG